MKVGKYDMVIIKKTVVIHPIMDSYIRKTWAILIENGKDASYSTALNFMLLATILEATKSEGLSQKARDLVWNFVEDQKTINELNLQDFLTSFEYNITVDMIKQTFIENFGKTFEKRNPQWGELVIIFNWLKSEASNAMYFETLDNINRLRMSTEEHFSKFKHLRKKVNKESQKVNKEIKKRYDELRKTRLRNRGKMSLIEGEHEEERVPPPK